MPKYAARWKDLGIQLSIDAYTLDAIAVNNARGPTLGRTAYEISKSQTFVFDF